MPLVLIVALAIFIVAIVVFGAAGLGAAAFFKSVILSNGGGALKRLGPEGWSPPAPISHDQTPVAAGERLGVQCGIPTACHQRPRLRSSPA